MALANITAINLMYGDYPAALARSMQGVARLDDAEVPRDDTFRRTIDRVHARALVANGKFED
ncbi:hypothetical protein, partial [Escherichia coli]|uniref:hypothetical protein n=1 Tax=Escherichia coli TaxID=562 RepID=UPI001F4A225A